VTLSDAGKVYFTISASLSEVSGDILRRDSHVARDLGCALALQRRGAYTFGSLIHDDTEVLRPEWIPLNLPPGDATDTRSLFQHPNVRGSL